MKRKAVFFNETLQAVVAILSKILPDAPPPLIIRDIFGRIRVAWNKESTEVKEYEDKLGNAWTALGCYGKYEGKKALSGEDFFDPDSIFNSPDILDYQMPETGQRIRILDRQITEQEWTRLPLPETAVPRLVFYGVKGGVGRSTAIAILAYQLAKKGKNVLLFDFDLESPGLSGLMLPLDRMAEFGIVDWFVEDAVGQGNEILPRMLSICPLSQAEGITGQIRIAAASGMDDQAYLSKLSRVYADIPRQEGGVERFPERMARLVKILEEREKPDIILIDSRAGLHDLAAVSIVGLGSRTFLFAVNSEQTWQGYQLLFSHWQSYPVIATTVRDRLAVVDALFPETGQEENVDRFLERSYDLFSKTLYDEIAPGSDEISLDAFNFDMGDRDAPHYPLRIKWNARFQAFNERLLSDRTITAADIESAYGDFLDGVESYLQGRHL
ncbi:MAG: CobQ/CobB/MinD/ParA nucleotide binding domain protein [Syntrophus sp. PtaU1.Bin208]|nr:MAG: CobQ/CobB/MinD/ParA nucleotide binding domain protein [Syntrophus sp. PtaU1.Bin208]